MRFIVLSFSVVFIFQLTMNLYASEHLQPILLNGDFEFLPGFPSGDPSDIPSTATWGNCAVPGLWWEAKGVESSWYRGKSPGFLTQESAWYRKSFNIPSNWESMGAQVEFDGLFWGCEVWLNGNFLGHEMGGYIPFKFSADNALIPGAKNTLIVKVFGWNAIPRDENGKFLYPVAVNASWANKSGGFIGDIRLRPHGRQRIEWIQILPSALKGSVRCCAKLIVDNPNLDIVSFKVYLFDASDGEVGLSSIPIKGPYNGEIIVTSPAIDVSPVQFWTPDTPNLYKAKVELIDMNGELSDFREISFGMRDFEIRDGDFYLNGNPIQLRGASLWEEVRFKRGRKLTLDSDFVRRYLVELPKQSNLNVLRSHLGPLYSSWLDIADEGGMMIIPEFPIFYWNDDARFKANQKRLYEALLPSLWNHPSIVIWAYSNEGWNDPQREYEREEIEPWFKDVDSTRPIMRSGDVNNDIVDIHAYEGFWHGTMSDFEARHIERVRNFSNHPLGNTEYLETGAGSNGIWYSKDRAKRFFDDDYTSPLLQQMHAEIAMEQTELLRRLNFDLILPYWFSDWVNIWQWASNMDDPSYPRPKPTLNAIRQAMAPTAISAPLAIHNVYDGSRIEIPIWIMNNTSSRFIGKVEVSLLSKNPEFFSQNINDSTILVDQLYPVTVGANAVTTLSASLNLPNLLAEDSEIKLVWLGAQLINDMEETVALSQRPLRIFSSIENTLRGMKVAVIGANENTIAFLHSQGAEILTNPIDFEQADTFVILPDRKGNEYEENVFYWARPWVERGRRCVILNPAPNTTLGAPLTQIPDDVYNLSHGTDFVFAESDSKLTNLRNLNGPDPVLSQSVKLGENDSILMYGYPDSTGKSVPAVISRSIGRGEVIISFVDLENRLAPNKEFVDPAAQIFLLQLLEDY